MPRPAAAAAFWAPVIILKPTGERCDSTVTFKFKLPTYTQLSFQFLESNGIDIDTGIDHHKLPSNPAILLPTPSAPSLLVFCSGISLKLNTPRMQMQSSKWRSYWRPTKTFRRWYVQTRKPCHLLIPGCLSCCCCSVPLRSREHDLVFIPMKTCSSLSRAHVNLIHYSRTCTLLCESVVSKHFLRPRDHLCRLSAMGRGRIIVVGCFGHYECNLGVVISHPTYYVFLIQS